MDSRDFLQQLLGMDDPRLERLKAGVRQSEPTFLDLSSGDGTPLLRIYSIRAGIAAKAGSRTEGYEDLIANLGKAENREVTVLHVNTQTEAFLVFTDAETRSILGVLSGLRSHR